MANVSIGYFATGSSGKVHHGLLMTDLLLFGDFLDLATKHMVENTFPEVLDAPHSFWLNDICVYARNGHEKFMGLRSASCFTDLDIEQSTLALG
jgi:hypothetical protein